MGDPIKIAVRPLVEYVFSSGSLESGFRSTGTMVEGTKAHQKLQKQYGELDQSEVYLSAEISYGDLLFIIDGRCDGLLLSEEGTYTIDEIKSTAADIGLITEESYPVHWAQAKFYAYMHAKEHGIPTMNIQLTYVDLDVEEQKRFMQTLEFPELESFVYEVVKQYVPYAEMSQQHRLNRNQSILDLGFPFPGYRAGQRKLAGSVYKTIEEGVSLFAKAPTGIGKTISTTFPALKAIGQGLLERIFYLTARTTTRTAAEEAFVLMQSKGLHLHTVTLTAKEKICFQEKVSCRKEDCEYADGYYDRINGAVLDILSNETRMSRGVIEEYARKHRVCPFEFSLDVSYASDAIICDYNYIFDPRISLKRMFAEQKNQTALLVDEAHNLVDRAREMFSSTLNKLSFLNLKQEYKEVNSGIYDVTKALNAHFIKLRKQAEDKPLILKEPPVELIMLVESFVLQAEQELANTGFTEQNPLLLETYFAAQNFVRISKLYDERYVTYVEVIQQEVSIKLFCLDPSYLLGEVGKSFRSHIYFSATLSPLGYYRDMLGADEEDYSLSIPSPFSPEQLDVHLEPLSTRYHDREVTKSRLVQLLLELTAKRKGNYLFFFPSYAYMNQIYEAFMEKEPDARVLLQRGNLSEEERDGFLSAFDAENRRTLIGFAVMGGIFSEGVDLVGDRLTGVVVVGVGLPQIGLERNIIRDYFNEVGKDGFDYAYVYPGMNKVLQAGGRLIRSENDHGVIVLVDDRYLQPHYAALLPTEWRDRMVVGKGARDR
ncbi:ATP-dependent DNA helicase [Paenibacillus anaericanus]|uniref:ATP-dependent DNA helicase n=1 Tax=Paenibacillus anaericanus TaxID=170367 RepID=A0A3S1DL71_9BACL|nr:ATP-dependent DNA helicase [Paenibacillus anaericanus]RUT43848.1 ATP-dependent DNA helicase [Paenibacillus anaericanus]